MANFTNNTTQLQNILAKVNELPDAGGGEDISAETAEYTAQLDELESTIDSLPDAGSGGGVELKTCRFTAPSDVYIQAATIFDGEKITVAGALYGPTVGDIDNILNGSFVWAAGIGIPTSFICHGCTEILSSGNTIYVKVDDDASEISIEKTAEM